MGVTIDAAAALHAVMNMVNNRSSITFFIFDVLPQVEKLTPPYSSSAHKEPVTPKTRKSRGAHSDNPPHDLHSLDSYLFLRQMNVDVCCDLFIHGKLAVASLKHIGWETTQ